MARDKANKSAGVRFTMAAAQEIADAVRTVKAGDRKSGGMPPSGNAQATPHYLAKLSFNWPKDTFARLTIWAGDPGAEQPATGYTVDALNRFSDAAVGDWVVLARANGYFYRVGAGGGGGQVYRGTYSGAWPGGGSMNIVTETVTGDTYQVKNWLTPISGTGGRCVFGPATGEYVLISFDLTSLADYGGTCILGSEGGSLKWFKTVICT
jgi:hypothetical protein